MSFKDKDSSKKNNNHSTITISKLIAIPYYPQRVIIYIFLIVISFVSIRNQVRCILKLLAVSLKSLLVEKVHSLLLLFFFLAIHLLRNPGSVPGVFQILNFAAPSPCSM